MHSKSLGLVSLTLVGFVAACGSDSAQPPGGGGGAGGGRRPSTPSLALLPANPTGADDLVARASGSIDPDGDAVTYRFKWSKDGAEQAALTTDTVAASFTAKGQVWRVVVSATDGTLASDEVTAEVTIENAAPTVTVAIQPASAGANDNLTAVATPIDADGDPVTLRYVWRVDTAVSPRTDAVIPATDTALGQRWTVTVTPNDGSVDGAPAMAEVVIGNSAPVLDSVTLGPDPATSADILRAVTGTVTDSDGDNVTFAYRWLADGVEIQTGASATLSPGRAGRGQAVTVFVTPNDSKIDGPEVQSNVVTLANSAPQIAQLVIDPAVGDATTTFSCRPQGLIDFDGDATSVDISWFVNGNGVTTTTNTLSAPAFARGDMVRCEATASDGTATSPAEVSLTVTISNAPPSLASVAIGPAMPAEGTTVTASITGAVDVDGDPVTLRYAWAVNGAVVATSTTIDGTSFNENQTIQLTVFPFDGASQGPGVLSNPLTAVNTPPSLAAVAISPSPAGTADDLTAMPQGFLDPDPGDAAAFSFAWTVNGGLASVMTGVLPSSSFIRGDTVAVTVTPMDGQASGPPVTSSLVTIANTPPGAPVVRIQPNVPDAIADLTCVIETPATDADSDTVTYQYAWQVDGNTTTETSSVVAAAATVAGQRWTCLATSNDGMDLGAVGRASAFISERCDSLEFDGTDDYVSPLASPQFDYTAGATVEAWVYWDGTIEAGFDTAIFTHRPSAESLTIGVFGSSTIGDPCAGRAPGQPYFRWGATGDVCLFGMAALTANRWVHIAGVHDGSGATLFINGLAVATTTTAAAIGAVPQDTPMGIGAAADGSGAFFSGAIDRVRVSTTAIYLADFMPQTQLASGGPTVALWSLDEGTGAVANDASGNGHDGVINGGALWATRGPACAFDASGLATQFATANCEYRTRCEPAFYGFLGNNEATCINEQTDGNTNIYNAWRQTIAAGRMAFDQQVFDQCVAALAVADCVRGVAPGTCDFLTGMRQVGQQCGVTNECVANAFCPVGSFGMCAACTPRTPAGGDCSVTVCAVGTECLTVGTQRLCIPNTADVGVACGTVATGLCRGRMQCVGNGGNFTCQRPSGPGAACDPAASVRPACNIFQNQTCVNNVCQTVSWVGVGGSCNAPSQCNVTAECDPGTGVCGGLPTAGQPCTPNNACAVNHHCDVGTCRADFADGATCAQDGQCESNRFCIDAMCGVYQWTECN